MLAKCIHTWQCYSVPFVEISYILNTYIHTQLQGGQRRRLCVGMSMVARNAVVILDEPTGKSALHSLSASLL